MAKEYVLYNPLSGACSADRLAKMVNADAEFCDITKLDGYAEFFAKLSRDDKIILCGGDGTINRFVNDTEGLCIKNEILYYPAGTGNDFALDLGRKSADRPFPITEYLKDLPVVTVNGKPHRFLNGVGYGVDGYCCEVGDELRKSSDKPVNYTSIAIKGLLFHYKPTRAKVTVDGQTHTYKKVWIAPTMNGRYYGGGMMPAPGQDRSASEKTLSVAVLHDSGKLKTLMVFPSIFKGKHVSHTEMVDVFSGHDITVEFDRPVALQIDGETVLNVSSYHACSKVPVPATV